MKKIISSFLVLAATTIVANARLMDEQSFREMDKRSDIIVVATPVSTKETDEQTNLRYLSPPIPVVGLSTEFAVAFALKGDSSLKKLVVHHYRLVNMDQKWAVDLASFDPDKSTRYLLFLRREPDGRYAPFDQNDPASTSMLKLKGAEWDKMQFEDFKKWLDAKEWLNETPTPDFSLDIQPGISWSGSGEYGLCDAALNGNLEKAKALFQTNSNEVFNQPSYAHQTPLHLAAEYGHKDVAELLLANGADVNARNSEGDTPLDMAAAFGHKEMVELLLAHQARINDQDMENRTPLHNAVFAGHEDLVELLVTNQANVNVTEDGGRTPLHIAAENGYTEIAAFLLASKANVNAKNREGQTPLGIAVLNKHKDMAELLRQHGGVE